MTKAIFKTDAKQIVDLLFETKMFKDSLTRDNLNTIEELIDFTLSSKFESYERAQKLLDSLSKIPK